MSKIIDVLEGASPKRNAPQHVNIQDELAKTYFHAAAKKPGKKKDIRARWPDALPWLIAAIAVIFVLVVVLFRSSIEIRVRVLGEMPSMPANLTVSRQAEGPDKGAFLVRDGMPDREIVKNVFFSGDAKEYSMVHPEQIVLCNSKGAGWANYTLELKEAVNLQKLDIGYTARGAVGGEELVIVIVDSNKRMYRMEKDLSSRLTGDWQRYTINFRPVRKAVDLSNISAIKFEFGNLTAGNRPGTVLYLKDVTLTKTKRLKWL